MGDVIPTGSPRQGELPAEYREASADELDARIRAAKATLGDRVVILGHFYQREEVVRHADYVGDSFQLANAAKAHPEAEAIVFCGVHFMAETADLLSTPEQAVILPNLAAGCSMADMADIDQVEECWEQLAEVYGDMDAPDADGLRARHPGDVHELLGRDQGVRRPPRRHRVHVVERADRAGVGVRARAPRAVLPRPAPRPQHREGDGRAARADADVEPAQAAGRQHRPTELEDARVILWHGFCSVHRRFTVDQIEKARAEHPGVRVIVHPECPMAVVDAADESGLDRLHPPRDRGRDRAHDLRDRHRGQPRAAPRGRQPAARRSSASTRSCAPARRCTASTPATSRGCSRGSSTGEVLNRITVPQDVAEPARLALERMLAAKPPAAPGVRVGERLMTACPHACTPSSSAAASPA